MKKKYHPFIPPQPQQSHMSYMRRHKLLQRLKENVKNNLHLVLDLDETLIHSIILPQTKSLHPTLLKQLNYRHPHIQNSSYVLQTIPLDQNEFFLVYRRPYLREFIWNVIQLGFNLHIFTYGTDEYCREIVRGLIQYLGYNPFQRICSRTDTLPHNAKTLSIMGLNPDHTIVLDDKKEVWKWDQRCVIQISPFDQIDDTKKPMNLLHVLQVLVDIVLIANKVGLLHMKR